MLENDFDDVLIHHGVKGMKWGVRKDRNRPDGVSSRTNREARKDAREFTKAKMFFGEGAGTRRKLIKAKVNQKSKDPSYKKAFDFHVNDTNMAKRSEQARSERRRKDIASGTARTARGVKNVLTNSAAPVTITALIIGTAASNPEIRAAVVRYGKTAYSTAARYARSIR